MIKQELSRLVSNWMPHEAQLLEGFGERGNKSEQTRQTATWSELSAFWWHWRLRSSWQLLWWFPPLKMSWESASCASLAPLVTQPAGCRLNMFLANSYGPALRAQWLTGVAVRGIAELNCLDFYVKCHRVDTFYFFTVFLLFDCLLI